MFCYLETNHIHLNSGNMLDPDHIKRCNKAERKFWEKAQGLRVLPSDQLLQFDCGGQQWVYEVCFPVGTYGLPSTGSMDFMEELLEQIETFGIPAPSPIEQRWTSASNSPLSPASVSGGNDTDAYDAKNALFTWVGIIMYLPSEDNDATGYRRQFITDAFKQQYCKVVRNVGQKYGLMCHWAKLELDGADREEIVDSVRSRFGMKVVNEYNSARDLYDPKRLLSSEMIDRVFHQQDNAQQ